MIQVIADDILWENWVEETTTHCITIDKSFIESHVSSSTNDLNNSNRQELTT